MYYFYFDENNKKICLSENDICPDSKNLFIPDTLECVNSCPSSEDNYYPYQFRQFCLNHCPLGSIFDESTKVCECGEKFWYQTSPGNYECLDGNCFDPYPVSIKPTRECVKTCKGTDYEYLYDKKCYDSCDFSPNTIGKEIDSSLAKYECICEHPWYYEIDSNNNNIIHCPANDSGIQKCKDYINKDLPYMIEATKECVNRCPSEYPYYFNNICYISCEYANIKYKYNVKSIETSFECQCNNLWNIDPEDTYETDKICYEEEIEECPLMSNTTDNSTTYLIDSTRECVDSRDKCPKKSYKINNICYDKCPEFTIEKKVALPDGVLDNICICRKDGYLYLEYEKYGNTHYKCGLTSCPDIFIDGENEYVRKNLLESEKKCVGNCAKEGSENNKYLFSFKNKCIQECPTLTEIIDDECFFYDLNNGEKINNLDILKEAANVQVKELYENAHNLTGYLLNKYDASLQIYSLGKINSDKELVM